MEEFSLPALHPRNKSSGNSASTINSLLPNTVSFLLIPASGNYTFFVMRTQKKKKGKRDFQLLCFHIRMLNYWHLTIHNKHTVCRQYFRITEAFLNLMFSGHSLQGSRCNKLTIKGHISLPVFFLFFFCFQNM